MLHFFKRGTRFGRALIFSALLLLVGIVFSVMNPLYNNLSDLLGWSDPAGGITLIDQSPSANVPDNIPMPACKVADGPCTVTANAADSAIIAPGKMPTNAIYIRKVMPANGIYISKVKPGPFDGMPWSPFVSAFFALWVICAIVGCYILVQETLDLVTNHFRSREESPSPPQD
jgi:hypothetical protein